MSFILRNRIKNVGTMFLIRIVYFFPGKSSFEHGIVNHALCAAMKTLLKVRMLIFITNMTILVPRLILNVICTSTIQGPVVGRPISA